MWYVCKTHAADARGEFQIQPSTSRVTAYDGTNTLPSVCQLRTLSRAQVAKQMIGKADGHVIVHTGYFVHRTGINMDNLMHELGLCFLQPRRGY